MAITKSTIYRWISHSKSPFGRDSHLPRVLVRGYIEKINHKTGIRLVVSMFNYLRPQNPSTRLNSKPEISLNPLVPCGEAISQHFLRQTQQYPRINVYITFTITYGTYWNIIFHREINGLSMASFKFANCKRLPLCCGVYRPQEFTFPHLGFWCPSLWRRHQFMKICKAWWLHVRLRKKNSRLQHIQHL